MTNTDLGYNKEHIVVIPGMPMAIRQKYDQFRQELMAHPDVLLGAFSSRVPTDRLQSSFATRPEGVPADQQQSMQTIWTDYDIIDLLGVELAAGRSFSRDFSTDGGDDQQEDGYRELECHQDLTRNRAQR